jgi:hypothetical protein
VDFLFSDDTIGRLGPKEWGDLLAAIWSEYDNKDYSYAGFAFLGDDSPMVLSGERMAYRIPNIQKTSGTRDGALVNYEMKKNDSI